MQIKIETREGAALRKQFPTSIPSFDSLGEAAVTLQDNGREVVISGTDERVAPRHHSVSTFEGGFEYWQDCGENFQEAVTFAKQVLEQGTAAYQL